MITITPAAAKQINQSAKDAHIENLPLRIVAKKLPDGSLHYGMGFDDVEKTLAEQELDIKLQSEGINMVVDAISMPLLKNMEIDFVELAPGEYGFIFKNPNDPHYSPPTEVDP